MFSRKNFIHHSIQYIVEQQPIQTDQQTVRARDRDISGGHAVDLSESVAMGSEANSNKVANMCCPFAVQYFSTNEWTGGGRSTHSLL